MPSGPRDKGNCPGLRKLVISIVTNLTAIEMPLSSMLETIDLEDVEIESNSENMVDDTSDEPSNMGIYLVP